MRTVATQLLTGSIMVDGLRGDFAQEYPAWKAGLAPLLEQITNEPMLILLWGPGARPQTVNKRQQIADHLHAQSPHNEAVTSEQLIASEPAFQGMHAYDAELLHVYAAHVVLVLIVPQATGSQTEIGVFWHDPDFREKAYLITPKLSTKERRKLERSGTFLQQGWVGYAPERQFPYTPQEYQDCTKIRDHCAAVVDQIRQRRGFNRLRAAKYQGLT